MKILTIAAFCLVAGLASADENANEEEGVIEEVQIRLAEMEQIDVTVEKPRIDTREELDTELEAILRDAESADETGF